MIKSNRTRFSDDERAAILADMVARDAAATMADVIEYEQGLVEDLGSVDGCSDDDEDSE